MEEIENTLKATGFPTGEHKRFAKAVSAVIAKIKDIREARGSNKTLADTVDLGAATEKKVETLQDRMLGSMNSSQNSIPDRKKSKARSVFFSGFGIGRDTAPPQAGNDADNDERYKEKSKGKGSQEKLKPAIKDPNGFDTSISTYPSDLQVRGDNKVTIAGDSSSAVILPVTASSATTERSDRASSTTIKIRTRIVRKKKSSDKGKRENKDKDKNDDKDEKDYDSTKSRSKSRAKKKAEISRKSEENFLQKMKGLAKVKYLASHTHFSEDEVLTMHKMFEAYTSKGTLTTDDNTMDRAMFEEFFRCTFGITDDVMLDRIFRYFDSDLEGSISVTEWIQNLSIILRGSLEEHIKYCFQVYDLNGDGGIGKEELMNIMQGCLVAVPGLGMEEDLNTCIDEVLDLVLKKISATAKRGQISLKNFRQAVHANPLLLEGIGHCLPEADKLISFMALICDDYYNFSTNFSVKNDPRYTSRIAVGPPRFADVVLSTELKTQFGL